MLVVEAFTGLPPAGRGLPGGKLLGSLACLAAALRMNMPRHVHQINQRKGDPSIPEFPTIEPAGRAAKNSPRFCWADFIVSGAQTASPLIRPAGSIVGGAARGKSQNQGGGDATAARW